MTNYLFCVLDLYMLMKTVYTLCAAESENYHHCHFKNKCMTNLNNLYFHAACSNYTSQPPFHLHYT